jgi:UDP-3-O-[3-hydroxymyristoyl] glucosamine N-acyltransferase
MKASEIAKLIGGTIDGDPNAEVFKPAKIEEGVAGAISFLANEKYESYIYSCQSSVILVSKDFLPKETITSTLIRVENVYASLTVLLEKFGEMTEENTEDDEADLISPYAFIHPDAEIGDGVRIDAFAYIGRGAKIADGVQLHTHAFIGNDVNIGLGTIIHCGAKILHGTVIGKNCTVHPGAVIGSDGFGFAPQEDGSFKKIPQLGIVELCDGVDVGANTVIDRATMGKTLIEKGVKLDNLIQIAHNVTIGENTVIAAQAGIAGSTKIGQNCMIGGQVGIVGHIAIANGTKIQAQSGVNKAVKEENTALFGSPALLYNDFLRANAVFKQLPELLKRVERLEKDQKIDSK